MPTPGSDWNVFLKAATDTDVFYRDARMLPMLKCYCSCSQIHCLVHPSELVDKKAFGHQ